MDNNEHKGNKPNKVEEKGDTISHESIRGKIDSITKDFDAKVKEYDTKTAEYNKFKTQRLEELSQMQGAYRALNALLHADKTL